MARRFHESVFRYIARIAESLSGQKSDKFQKFPTLCLYHSLSTTQSFGLISLRRVLVSFRLCPFPSTTQSFGLISLRSVLVSFRLCPFPPTTQSLGLISLRRVLVSFRLGPFPSTTQSFGLISLRRVLVSFRLCPFPPTTQSFGLISLRRGTEWGIHCAIYRGGGVLANCSGLRDTLGLKRAKLA